MISAAHAERRVALIIGNGAYKHAPLINPANDAGDMADAFRDLGFEVIEKINANKREMVNTVNIFGQKLKRSDVGIFFYAGHAMQINGRNYLIPIKARVASESDVEFEAFDAARVLGKMHEAENRLNIIILDACRDNPFSRSFRTDKKGLAQMDAPIGSILVYATAPGSVAADGKGRNGVFTKHLLKNLKRPDLTVQEVFTEAGLGVLNETGRKQVPWVSTTPIPRYYLAGGSVTVQKPSEPKTASFISVESNVSGATVFLDGRMVGKTPLPDTPATSGEHIVRVEMGGYEPYSKRVRFRKGRSMDLTVYLDKAVSTKGALFVETEPENAKIRILNISPKFYPGIELSPGKYHVEVAAAGYKTKEMWVTIEAGEDKSLDIRLEKLVSLGPKVGDVWQDPVTGMGFVWVPGGCFNMGSPQSESDRGSAEGPVHEVCVDGFWMGKYEVTNEQYRKYKSGHNSKDYKGRSLNGGNRPAVNVNWNDATAFSKWLTRQNNNRYEFRLPTEAEWEYAGRAGTTAARYWGEDSDDACQYANVHDQTSKRINKFKWQHHNCDDGYAVTAPVGSFQPNAFGLYDMLGNVWEWCEDIYSKNAYSKHQRSNPIYTEGGSFRVIRGGSWVNLPGYVRSAFRGNYTPDFRVHSIGVRLVRK